MTSADPTALTGAPARTLDAKLLRRLTQWRAARPFTLHAPGGLASFTFDDFPKSAGLWGAELLETAGARGTFYACAGLAGAHGPSGPLFEAADVVRLAAAGHEIGCHTHGHLDCAQATPAAALTAIADNARALAALGAPAPLRAFAYPFGETRPALKRALPATFATGRGVLGGINVGRVDLAQLRAVALFGPDAERRALSALQAAARQGGWVVFFTHDVSQRPSAYGAQPGLIARALTAAAAYGVEVATMTAAAARLGVLPREHAA